MNEVFTLADRVTVLRDGQFVASATRAETNARPGRALDGRPRDRGAALRAAPDRRRAMLEVAGPVAAQPARERPARSGGPHVLRSAAGEVLGVAGLLGAGRTELLEALFGASPLPPAGTITLDGRPVRFRHPGEAIAAGVALVTEDRKTLGLFDRDDRRREHHASAASPALTRGGLIDRRAEARAVAESIERLAIKTAGGDAAITSLSGGNQQKCIIARWLLIEPKLLLLDEPTRGIDVGAKAEIYDLIRRLVAQGMAIIMTSSELPELLTVADRILVLCEGRLTAELPRAEATEEAIMHAATQFLDRAKPQRRSGFPA